MKVDERLIQRAKDLALKSHEGQWVFNNPGVTPVSAHLEEVAKMVRDAGGTTEVIAAAWLHDTVEDTDLTLARIREGCGEVVADLVDSLTDPEEFADLSVTERKRVQSERIRAKGSDSKLIKLADQISNCRMAIGPERNWETEKNLAYVEGLRLVANECKGISVSLDNTFDDYYAKAKSVLLKELPTL
jgi:guanosine-3',5'-bis(diphosphate) 3'-pyrophosphohydrolase